MMDEQTPTPQPADDLITYEANQSISLERALQLLEKGSLQYEHGRLRWSSNFTFLVSLCQDDLRLRAIYKPQRGERPLWDFPDGTLCYREVAAYIVSEALGWRLVPPTILRKDAPRGLGSVQLYIDHDPEVNYFTLDDNFLPQLARFALFDAITNNADRKGGHCLLGPDQKLWGIDHGICFHSVPKLRTVIWNFAGQPIPPGLLAEIDAFYNQICASDSEIQQQLQKLLSTTEIDALLTRTQRLLRRKLFPQPGHGPYYPWPPI